MGSRTIVLATLAAVIVGLVSTGLSSAAFPGGNGRIVFSQGSQLYDMNADGTDVRQLTSGAGGAWASYSPDGSRIVFVTTQRGVGHCDLAVMAADGSGQTLLTDSGTPCLYYYTPTWSPDGSMLAVVRNDFRIDGDEPQLSIWLMNADGSNETRLTPLDATHAYFHPSWSPDGSRIAVVKSNRRQSQGDIVLLDPNGGPETNLTCCGTHLYEWPDWSPDGTKIVFGATSGSPRSLHDQRRRFRDAVAPRRPSDVDEMVAGWNEDRLPRNERDDGRRFRRNEPD